MDQLVVYVAGSMRSATTVVGQLFSSFPGHVLLGEVRTTIVAANGSELCDCGSIVSECVFWTRAGVLTNLSDRPLAFEAYQLLRATRLLKKSPGAPFEAVIQFLMTLSESAGGNEIIDTSKSAAGALLWRRTGNPVHVVHCVRNPISVARAQANASTNPGGVSVPYWKSLIEWVVHNAAILCVGPLASSYTMIRFSQLRKDPEAMLGRLRSNFGQNHSVSTELAAAFQLGTTHMIFGNPRRISRGRVDITKVDQPRR